jgi:hypothetical protein
MNNNEEVAKAAIHYEEHREEIFEKKRAIANSKKNS